MPVRRSHKVPSLDITEIHLITVILKYCWGKANTDIQRYDFQFIERERLLSLHTDRTYDCALIVCTLFVETIPGGNPTDIKA